MYFIFPGDMFSPGFNSAHTQHLPPRTPKNNAVVEKTDKVVTEVAGKVTAAAQPPTANPKKHIWKSLADGASASYNYVLEKISELWEEFLEFLDACLDNGDPKPFDPIKDKKDRIKDKKDRNQAVKTQNENAIKQFSTQIKDYEKNTKATRKLIADFDISSPEKLLKWLQIPDTLKFSSTPGAIVKSIEVKLAQVKTSKSSIKVEPPLEVNPISNPTEDQMKLFEDRKKVQQKHAKLDTDFARALDKQIAELEELLGEAGSLIKKGEAEAKEKGDNDTFVQWQNQFERSKDEIATAFNVIQQKTLIALQEMEGSKTSLKSREDLKFCFNYYTLYQTLKNHDLINPLNNNISLVSNHHADIEEISGKLGAHFDQGIGNLGNTCWLNSGLQAIRKSPVLMDLLNAKLEPLVKEEDEHFNDRERIQKKLVAVFNALGRFGDPNEINEAVRDLEKTMLSTNTDVVPTELKIEQGRQKDPTDLIRCFFNVVNYRIPCTSIMTINGRAPQESDDRDGLGCLNVFPQRGKTFEELVAGAILPENVQGFRENGQEVPCVKEKKLKGTDPLPEVFVTALQRLTGDPVRLAELKEVRDRIRKEFEKGIPGTNKPLEGERLAKSAEMIYEASWEQLNSKNEDPVSIMFDSVNGNYILDLTHSALTDRLPRLNDSDGNPTVRQPVIYRLVSAINHISYGGGISGGHYTACGMKPDNVRKPEDFWSNLDDSSVSTLSPQAATDRIARGYVFIWELYKGPVAFPEVDEKVAYEESETKVANEAQEAQEAIRDNQPVTEPAENKPEATPQDTGNKVEGSKVEAPTIPPMSGMGGGGDGVFDPFKYLPKNYSS